MLGGTQINDLDVVIQALNQDTFEFSIEEVKITKFATTIGSFDENEKPEMMSSERDVAAIITDWLQPAIITEHETYLNNDHYLKGTCQWFRHHPAFLSWVDSRFSSHLWVQGLPGSGKSVLAANAISILKENDSAIISYFFCSRNEPTKRSASSIIRTIINQLAQQSPRILLNLNRMRLQGYNFAQPLSLTWRQLIVEQLENGQERTYIVIDGLDECEMEERKTLMNIIISLEHTANIFWLIFSGYTPDIAKSLVGPNFVLKPTDSRQDIRLYIEQYVNKSRLMSSEPIKTQVVDRLSRGSAGLFLWVKLMLQQLEKEQNVSGVLSTLQSLPLGTENLYHKILATLASRLNDGRSTIVSTAFVWIASVCRSLTIKELTEAVRLSLPNTGELLDLERILRKDCDAVVSVSNSGSVQFIHQTFREYISSNYYNGALAVDLLEAHTTASNVSLSYLSDSAFSNKLSSTRFQTVDITLLCDKYPLLSYAALYWPVDIDHARAERNPELLKRLSDFVSSSNLLTVMEVALTIEGIHSLQRWMLAFSHLETRLQNTIEWETLKRFSLDFRRLIRHYGHILDKYPSELYYLIDECFPRKSHFWKSFGHSAITFANGQMEEWDPLITTLKQHNVSGIAVSPNGLLAAYDDDGISVWNLDSYTEIVRIPVSSSLVVAVAFDGEDSLAILTQDGDLRFASPPSWKIKNESALSVDLPTAVRKWQGSQFWSTYFKQFDPLQVALDFVGNGILAGNTLINLENKRRRQAIPGLSPSLTVCQLRCTRLGDLVAVSDAGEIVTRRLGSHSSLERFDLTIESSAGEALTRRLLAVSNTGQLIATCEITVHEGNTVSESVFECWRKGLMTRVLREQFGTGDKITCAAFSFDESMLAVNSYNTRTLSNTTKIWMLLEEPQLVWETSRYDDYTTTLAFGLEDRVLINAGRFLRIWDVSKQLFQSKLRSSFASESLAIKISGDGRQIASVPIKDKSSSLILQSTDCDMAVEIPWPKGLDRNIDLTDPLAYSADSAFIAWDQAIISTETQSLVGSVPLSMSEQISCLGGFSPDSSIVVYCVNRSVTLQPHEDPSIEAIDSPGGMSSDNLLHNIISYNWNGNDRRPIFSALELSAIRTHPTRPLVCFIAKSQETQWTIYIYDLNSSQFAITIPWSDKSPDPSSICDMTFSTFGTLTMVYPCAEYKDDGDNAWTDVNMTRLHYDGNEVFELHSDTYQIAPWINCRLLPSGRVLYFFRDGWLMLWDDKRGLSRVKYLSSHYKSISSVPRRFAAVEVGPIIRVAIDDLRGLAWFDIKSEDLYDRIFRIGDFINI